MAEILTEHKEECIHKYQKGMGDESWDYCDLEDTCVEGDYCKYCTEVEE